MSEHDESAMTARLQAALDALPPPQRQVFLSIRHEDASYAELARRLGITLEEAELAFAQALIALVKAADGGA